MKRLKFALSLLFIFCSAFGAVAEEGAESKESNRVVTTTGMIGDLVANIGGTRVTVSSLMGPGVDPHLYKATQGDLERLTGSNVIFYNGLHLEGKMVEIFEKVSKRKPCFAISADIDPAKLRKPPEFEGQFDPHIWFDLSLWILAADTVEKRLSELYPADAGLFKANLAKYRSQMEELHKTVKEAIATIPANQRVMVTAHDAFGYFGRAYNIDVMGLQGISTATEYGLNDLTRVINVIINRKVKAIFVESSVPKKFVIALQEGVKARGGEVSVGGELFSDAMGSAGTPEGTYLGMIKHNVDTIVHALK